MNQMPDLKLTSIGIYLPSYYFCFIITKLEHLKKTSKKSEPDFITLQYFFDGIFFDVSIGPPSTPRFCTKIAPTT